MIPGDKSDGHTKSKHKRNQNQQRPYLQQKRLQQYYQSYREHTCYGIHLILLWVV